MTELALGVTGVRVMGFMLIALGALLGMLVIVLASRSGRRP